MSGDDRTIIAMVPMRDNHGLTRNLCRGLAEGGPEYSHFWIYDNGSANRSAQRWLQTIEATGRYAAEVIRWGPTRGLYGMWNDAIRHALQLWLAGDLDHRVYLAILNNDLIVPPGFLGHLADALDQHRDAGVWITYPDWPAGWPRPVELTGEVRRTSGTRNAGGMSGYAFMLDVSRFVTDGLDLIDEGYVWLAGDGDLVWKVEQAGGTAAAVEGLPVGHLERASANAHSWTLEQGRRDMRRSRQPGQHNARR